MTLAKFKEKANSYFKIYTSIVVVFVLIIFLLAQFIFYRQTLYEDLVHDAELQSKIMAVVILDYEKRGSGFWNDKEFEQKIYNRLSLLADKRNNIVNLKILGFNPRTNSWQEVISVKRSFTGSLSSLEKKIASLGESLIKGNSRIWCNGEGYVVNGTTVVDMGNERSKLKVSTDVEANKFVQQQIWFAVVLVLLFSGIVIILILQYRLFFLTLYKPLDNLIEGMKVISRGNLEYRIPVVRRDKLGNFIESFNNMVKELKKSREDLEKELSVTKDQREKIFKVYRDVIFAVTQGKMVLVNVKELPSFINTGKRLAEVNVSQGEDVGLARKVSKHIINELFPQYSKTQKILLCVSEAATNVLKHAGSGKFFILKINNTVRFVFTDKGPGMDFSHLPSAIFYKGFSTQISLGYGFSLIYSFVDKMILSSTKNGTTVAFDVIMTP